MAQGAAANVHFGCTLCGKCCRDLRLALCIEEAIAWAESGNQVQLLVEALPWPEEPGEDDMQRLYDRHRTFPAMSGDIPFRIGIMLVAWNDGPCPHLQPDMRCGNYAGRPRACRIYPLESRPFAKLDIGQRLCPPEAWSSEHSLLMAGDAIADTQAASVLRDHQRVRIADVPALRAAADRLGWSRAGFANEGFAVFTPRPADLAKALRQARGDDGAQAESRQWTVVTNRKSTLATLFEAGCKAEPVSRGTDYLGSFPEEDASFAEAL